MAPRRVPSIAVAALVAASACGGSTASQPDATRPAAENSRAASGRRNARVVDGAPTCEASRRDDDPGVQTLPERFGIDSPRPDTRTSVTPQSISGRLVDDAGDAVRFVELRFWSPNTRQNTGTHEDGTFSLPLHDDDDLTGVVFDVDALLSGDIAAVAGVTRVHLGTTRPGDTKLRLRLPARPFVIAAGKVIDEDGAPLANWHVTASAVATNGIVASADTDSEGRFRIISWTTPNVALNVDSDKWPRRRIEAQSVDPATGLVRIVIDSPGLIAGRVVAEHGGDVRGAVVRLRRVDDDAERTAVVDAAGEFVFKRLDSQSLYRLRVECAGYVEEPHEGDCSVDQLDVRLYLTKNVGVIAGRVVDSSSSALRAAWLRFVALDGGSGFQLMTDDDGVFRTYEARDIEYDVRVLAPGDDGRLVPGASIGRCRGGATALLFRAAR